MDLTTKTAEIAKILIERGETVAVGESSAGGLVSASLLAVPGASKYFMGRRHLYAPRPQTAGEDRFQGSSGCALFERAVCEPSGRQRPRAVERDMGFGGNRSRGADRKQLWRRCRAHVRCRRRARDRRPNFGDGVFRS